MEKQRISYADFQAQMKRDESPFEHGTLAWALWFYIADMAKLGKPIGESKAYAMEYLQRAKPWCGMRVSEMEEQDFLAIGEWLKQTGVKPSTVSHYMTDVRVSIKHARSRRKECRGFAKAIEEMEAASASLRALGLMGNGEPRDRRTKDEEFDAICTHCNTPSGRGHDRIINMPLTMRFARISSRRCGEICRLEIPDIDWTGKLYTVRDVKHPTKKLGNHKTFVLFPEIEDVLREAVAVIPRTCQRVFPYRSRSVTSAYCNAKKALGIEDLHFHDLRADAISYWLLKLGNADLVAKLVSGHDDTKMIQQTYDRRHISEIVATLPSSVWAAAPQPMALAA